MVAPLLTVITVVRNGAEFLEQTILSVTRPRPVTTEYLVIDGGSTDGTVDIIKRHSDGIRYWISEPDRGIYDAMNKGWAAAVDGSHILYLGAGDLLLSLPEEAEQYRPDTVLYGTVEVGRDHCFVPHSDWRLKYYNSLHHQGLLIPKGLHPAPPFDCRYGKYADFDFNQRLYRRGVRFRYHPELRSYAMPDGVTEEFSLAETVRITRKNFGAAHAILSILAYLALRCLPPLKRLRPYELMRSCERHADE